MLQWQKDSQMHEYLHPSTLQTVVTNTLQAAQSNLHGHGGSRGFTPREGKPFLCQPREASALGE